MMYSYPYFRPAFFPPMYRRSVPPHYRYQGNVPNVAGQAQDLTLHNSSGNKNDFGSFGQAQDRNVHNSMNQQKEQSFSDKKIESSTQETRSSEDSPIFEIFGIKLYFDDLLLLGLLFFLYSEGVEDQELFFALVLLLLS